MGSIICPTHIICQHCGAAFDSDGIALTVADVDYALCLYCWRSLQVFLNILPAGFLWISKLAFTLRLLFRRKK